MVQPSGEGAVRCMRQALATVDGRIDYVNTHGTATGVGDSREIAAIREVFGDDMPHSPRPSRSPATRSAPPACR